MTREEYKEYTAKVMEEEKQNIMKKKKRLKLNISLKRNFFLLGLN